MNDEGHQKYLQSRIDATIQANLRLEQEWLQSIHAPVNRLPKHVAEAVASRVLLLSLPTDLAATLIEDAGFIHLLKSTDALRRT